jgi:hypothetical protein
MKNRENRQLGKTSGTGGTNQTMFMTDSDHEPITLVPVFGRYSSSS